MGRRLIANAPEGVESWLLAQQAGEAARATWPQIFVCHDDARVARLRAALGFFCPALEVLTVPA